MTEPENSPPAPLGPALTVSALARRLGVAPATLRTWDRRYGVGPTDHSAGSHRRYSPADVQRMQLMRRLTLDGVMPAEAARVALAEHGDQGQFVPAAPAGRGGGGRIVALPGVEPEVRGLARAAMALDAPAAYRIVAEHVNRSGTCWTWDHLIVPVLVGVGDRWETTGSGVDVEHVLAGVVSAVLASGNGAVPAQTTPRPVLLAAAAEEEHTLPLEVLSRALSERGVGSRLLGARVPSDALGDAVRRSGASAVFVWAHAPEVIDQSQWALIPHTRPRAQLVVGGPGWGADLPEDVQVTGSLTEAVEVLTRSALG